MSRYPAMSAAGDAVPASIFARLREHLARFPGDVIPFQIGDTYLAPPARLETLAWADAPIPELYAYGNPAGWPPLIDAIAAKARDVNGIPGTTTANVQLACGATHALACAVQALCDPGDEIILLSPHWPLIRGIALGYNVVPLELPFDATIASLEAAITPRTTAIYYATPNNPDGVVIGPARLAALAELAARRNLWIIADEVYEHYVYTGAHASIAALPHATERTVTVFSFAKSYAQAGLRIGYAIAPEPVAATLKKLVNHSIYNVPVAMQQGALAALATGDAFLAGARATYLAARDRARARLVAPADVPDGGAYLWVDFRRWGDDCLGVLERCAAAGVLLAPGAAFGPRYAGFARLCFTGVPPDRLDEGIDRINAVIA